MNKYGLSPSPKTKFLNFFRSFFTNIFFEKIILTKTLFSHSHFFFKLIPPNYLYPKKSIRNVIREEISYSLDISHVIDHGIYFGYPELGYNFIADKLINAKTILDIGANIGSTAMRFAKANTKADIYAFEPHPKNYERALYNLGLNNFNNISFLKLGIGEKQENLKLYEVNEHNPSMNRIIEGQHNFPFVVIAITTIDDFVRENKIQTIDFIKIDIEGFEYSALKGGEKTLKLWKPSLFIELDDSNLRDNNHSALELIKFLKSLGYYKIYKAENMENLSEEYNFKNCHFDIIAL